MASINLQVLSSAEFQKKWIAGNAVLIGCHAESFASHAQQWTRSVLSGDARTQDVLDLFSPKLPEPYFGAWLDAHGQLSTAGKMIIVLTNPGDGMKWDAYEDASLSVLDMPHWKILRQYYVNGFVSGRTRDHRLPYKSELASYRPRHDRRRFAWDWWLSQWENIKRSTGIRVSDEETRFLTLETFAYQRATAAPLNGMDVNALNSSRLIAKLVRKLAHNKAAEAIVLVGLRRTWERVFREDSLTFTSICTACGNKDHQKRFLRATDSHGHVTATPVLLLHGARGMRFPRRANGGSCLFPDMSQ